MVYQTFKLTIVFVCSFVFHDLSRLRRASRLARVRIGRFKNWIPPNLLNMKEVSILSYSVETINTDEGGLVKFDGVGQLHREVKVIWFYLFTICFESPLYMKQCDVSNKHNIGREIIIFFSRPKNYAKLALFSNFFVLDNFYFHSFCCQLIVPLLTKQWAKKIKWRNWKLNWTHDLLVFLKAVIIRYHLLNYILQQKCDVKNLFSRECTFSVRVFTGLVWTN